jgi:hypothetical protein
MTIKSVHQKSRTDVPHRNSFIRRRTQKSIIKLRKHHMIYTIHMSSESVPDLSSGHIIKSTRVVHISWNQEVAIMVEVNTPDWLRMVFERMQTWHTQEIPDLNGPISWRSRQMSSFGVETDVGDPLRVSLATHYQLSVGDRPDLPGHIIRRRRQKRLLFVEIYSRNGLFVCLELYRTYAYLDFLNET